MWLNCFCRQYVNRVVAEAKWLRSSLFRVLRNCSCLITKSLHSRLRFYAVVTKPFFPRSIFVVSKAASTVSTYRYPLHCNQNSILRKWLLLQNITRIFSVLYSAFFPLVIWLLIMSSETIFSFSDVRNNFIVNVPTNDSFIFKKLLYAKIDPQCGKSFNHRYHLYSIDTLS